MIVKEIVKFQRASNMKFILFVFHFFWVFSTAQAYQNEISACCIFQNEDRFLKEWIDYHRLIGVTHFYMYDNESTDHSYAVLEPYIKAGVVEYILWPGQYNSPKEWWHVQRAAYIDAVNRAKENCKWLCIIDTDEFIVPIKDHDLKAFLKDYESYGGVCVNWIFYGTSGIQRIPNGQWIITRLLYRSKLSEGGHRIVKSIVRPERVDAEESFFPHTCAYIDNYYHVDPCHKKFKRGASKDICIDRIRIHHYWARDKEFLWQHKLPRNERWYGKDVALRKIQAESHMNANYDPIILDVIRRLKH